MNKRGITFPFDFQHNFYQVLSIRDPKSLDVTSCITCLSIMHSSAVITAKGHFFPYTAPHQRRRTADAFPLVAQTGANSLPTEVKTIPATVVLPLERTA